MNNNQNAETTVLVEAGGTAQGEQESDRRKTEGTATASETASDVGPDITNGEANEPQAAVAEQGMIPAVAGLISGATLADTSVSFGFSPDIEVFFWETADYPGIPTRLLGKRLADTGELFLKPGTGILQLAVGAAARHITKSDQLEGFIRSRIPVIRLDNGTEVGVTVPATDLKIMLSSEELMSQLPVVDRVTSVATYTSDWVLTRPGYNDGPAGERCFYTGVAVEPKLTPMRIREFLSAMKFKSEADATNAVALALTCLLRFMWPGKKPFGAVTANKSHAGKDTVVDFAAGRAKRVEISWHFADWANQNEAVAALKDPEVGVLTLGNIRSGAGVIESAFIERTVTSPDVLCQSSKMGGAGFKRDGDFVVAATANNGRFSPDLANRALPIHLEVIGDIAKRDLSIGNPRHEFLPKYQEEIEAELCGLVEKWKSAGSPKDASVKHPMTEWARTIGGILKANGFVGFLGNWSFQRDANDVERESLAIIADALPHGEWLRVAEIRRAAEDQGVVGSLMGKRHRESEKSIERQLGVLLSSHQDETLTLITDDSVASYVISKARKNLEGQLATAYKFEAVARESAALPCEVESTTNEAAA